MKRLWMLLLLMLVSCAAVGGTPYAQLSSAVNQANGMVTTEIVDGSDKMPYTVSGGLEVEVPGIYLIVYAPQTGDVTGCGNYWLKVNNTDVPNSNIRVCQTANTQTTVAISQGILELKRGDSITFYQSGILGIQATQPPNEPLIPSVIISVHRI